MSGRRLYVAGPMTGYPDLNYPAFTAAAVMLRAAGWEVVSPAEINTGFEHEGWDACMTRDLQQLVTCWGIYLLPGWEQSRGALWELQVAREHDLRVFYPASVLLSMEAACQM